MLTTKEKQYKLIKSLGLDVGSIIMMVYGGNRRYLFICESANKERYFLESLDLDMCNLPISYLISREWVICDDCTRVHPEFMLYTGGRMQGKEQLYHDFTKMLNNNIPVIVDTDNMGVHIAINDMKYGLQRRVNSSPKIDNVYYNTDKKTTVVNWSNGDTTKVKCAPEDKFDLENGIMAAIAKYHCENKSKILRNTIARAAKKAKNTTKKEN